MGASAVRQSKGVNNLILLKYRTSFERWCDFKADTLTFFLQQLWTKNLESDYITAVLNDIILLEKQANSDSIFIYQLKIPGEFINCDWPHFDIKTLFYGRNNGLHFNLQSYIISKLSETEAYGVWWQIKFWISITFSGPIGKHPYSPNQLIYERKKVLDKKLTQATSSSSRCLV